MTVLAVILAIIAIIFWILVIMFAGKAGKLVAAPAPAKPAATPAAAPAPAAPTLTPAAAPAAAPASGGGDDLTQIRGVGPTIVKKLNGMGYTTFKQIAELTPQQVAEIDEKLNFKGRIDREGWIEQAKKLAV